MTLAVRENPRASQSERIPRLEWYSSPESIYEALENNDTALLKAKWIVEQSRCEGCVLGKRQQLPPEAFWNYKDVFTPNGKFARTVIAVSHAWLTEFHPDPDGRNLQLIGKCLSFLIPVYGDLAVYWDWCSIYQEPRSVEENASFEQALYNSHLWWIHSRVLKLLVTSEPEGSGTTPYHERGWPNFEREVSFMNTHPDSILDLAHFGSACQDFKSTTDICTGKRPPPITPKTLALRLTKKRFGKDSDREIVQRLYQECFMSWISSIKDLNLAMHAYTDEDIASLAGAIRHCGRLQHLDLSANQITNEGAKLLAAAVPRCRRLVHLELQGNNIGAQGIALLRKNWMHARKPEEGLNVVSIDEVRNEAEEDTIQRTASCRLTRVCIKDGMVSVETEKEKDPDFYYQGMYKNNQRHGLGTLSNRVNGFKYKGQFVEDLMAGHGEASWQDGSKYVGEWLDGKKSGIGEFTSPNGVRYVGAWVSGHRQGHGTQEYQDGGKYTGSWADNVCGGQGSYAFVDGSHYDGMWRHGRYNGPGVMHNRDGTSERLLYKEGFLMSRQVVHTEMLPAMCTRSGNKIYVSRESGKGSVQQKREEVHKPTQLPSLRPSNNLISRSCQGLDLSAPPLRPRSASRLKDTYHLEKLPLTAR